MATIIQKTRWQLHLERHRLLFRYGIKNGLIREYDEELLSKLRHVYYGGIPVSILLLHERLSNGHCYDRGTMVTLGFGDDDFEVVDASIDTIRLNPKFIDKYKNQDMDVDYGDHCFAIRKKSDGTEWVYDTSLGLVIEKNLYFKMEKPKVRVVNSKEKTVDYLNNLYFEDCDIERDKYAVPLILPMIEADLIATQPFYQDKLKREIDIFKREINYDKLCTERELEKNRKR